MTIHWLHLSDIHFHGKDNWRDERARRELLTYLAGMFNNGEFARPDLVFCTGDIAFGETGAQALQKQYESAKGFFTDLLRVCGAPGERLPVSRLFVVPGNHDINRKEVDEDAQAALVALARDSRNQMARINSRLETKPTPFTNAMKRLAAYEDFVKEFLPHQVDTEGRCIYAQVVAVRGVKLGIAGFNSAWSCAGPEDDRNLWLGAEWQFNRAQRDLAGADIRLGLIHHPIDWLNEAEREVATRRIARDFDFWLHGHAHNAWVEALGNHVRIGAGAVGAGTSDEFGVNLVRLVLPDVLETLAPKAGSAPAGAERSEVHLHQFKDGWTIQPIAGQAPRGIWPFDLPERVAAWVAGRGNAQGGRVIQMSAHGSVNVSGSANPVVIRPPRFELSILTLQNFRNFAQLTVTLHPRLTVLVAPNGAGKSTLLGACRQMLQAYVAGFDLSGETASGIALDDVRVETTEHNGQVRKLPCGITAQGNITSFPDLCWSLSRTDERPDDLARQAQSDDAGLRQLRDVASEFQEIIRLNQNIAVQLPVIAFYGTARVRSQQTFKANENNDVDQYNRTFGYRDCLNPDTGFQHFADWFTWLCQWRDQELVRQAKFSTPGNARTGWDAMLAVIQQAVDSVLRPLTGWHTLDYSVMHQRSLVLQHDEYGVLKVAQLSDGIRGMLAMVADLAWRCIKLNPHLGEQAARDATGVVLIDELDMHLHPAWQQRIADQLQTAFPGLQFIVSTHSPQVLSSVAKECIRIIHLPQAGVPAGDEAANLVEEPGWQTRGVASADILIHIMGMGSIPDVEQARQLSDYRALIEQGLHDSSEAQALRGILEQHFGAQHEAMIECERLISLYAFKRKMAAKRAGVA
jgi:predicted ATP-binding protein involved in virulence/predicted phosphodiesterase